MAERIYKLQPNRTINLRGFDGFGAAASLHSATSDSFVVSGVFRDAADFAVLVLYDADNFFEHPSIRYLPDFDFTGLKLDFDVDYTGLMPIDSVKFATIDWPSLNISDEKGAVRNISLAACATATAEGAKNASGEFTIVADRVQAYDHVSLWYLNFAFPYYAPRTGCAYQFYAGVPGAEHWISVGSETRSYVEQPGDTSATIAAALARALADIDSIEATTGDGTDQNGPTHQLNIRAILDDGLPLIVSSSAGEPVTIYGVGAGTIAADLAKQINEVDWQGLNIALPIRAEVDGAKIRIESVVPGFDGNSISMYSLHKNDRLGAVEDTIALAGGAAAPRWHVSIDFSQLAIGSVRQMWLTFAPLLSIGAPYEQTEWEARFTNWTVTGPEERRKLCVAGRGSVRIEDDDSRCSYSGAWILKDGFYTRGFARRSLARSDTATIAYKCAAVHDLYVGTSLASDRGIFRVAIDGVPRADIDANLPVDGEVVARRLLARGVAPGRHKVVLTHADDRPVYFDFLEAAVPSDIPDPRRQRTTASPALDYSTDHTYKLSPARLMWNFDQLGFAGPMNEYIGVFWWNQRTRSGGSAPAVVMQFDGVFVDGDNIFFEIGGFPERGVPGQVIGKTVFPFDNVATIAQHFAAYINSTFVGIWARAENGALTITAHSAAPLYALAFRAWTETVGASTGTLQYSGSLKGGSIGDWVVDVEAPEVLNRAARDWHADFFRQCAARGRELTVASSMELVNPPPQLPARFPSGAGVETAVGFGNLRSTHCAFNTATLDYKRRLCLELCDLMAGSGLTPDLQFGEFCWWYFADTSGMAFYDDDTAAEARVALGRDLYVFRSATDDPAVNGGLDATFLRDRLFGFVSSLAASVRSAHPTARVEVLFPYDVNYPKPVGAYKLGGRLLRFINFPQEWSSKQSSGLDRLKMEGLDFGAGSRNLDLVVETMRFPLDLGWPRDSVRYMVPVFNGGCPWTREARLAAGLGLQAINYWAFDHFCIFGWDPAEPDTTGRVIVT